MVNCSRERERYKFLDTLLHDDFKYILCKKKEEEKI